MIGFGNSATKGNGTMRTLNYVVLVLVAFLVAFGVSANAQGTRVDAVQVDAIETTDAATYVLDTAGKSYRFPLMDTTAVNTIDANVDTGSFVDPSGCLPTIDADGARRCNVLYAWTDTGWTTVYVDYSTAVSRSRSQAPASIRSRSQAPATAANTGMAWCRQVATSAGAFSNVLYESCLKQEREAAERLRGNTGNAWCRQVATSAGAFSNVLYESCLRQENDAAERLRQR